MPIAAGNHLTSAISWVEAAYLDLDGSPTAKNRTGKPTCKEKTKTQVSQNCVCIYIHTYCIYVYMEDFS
jgi:hypothetical protein